MTAPIILLTGAKGQIGFELCRSLAPLAQVVVFDRQQCDLTNLSALRQQVRRINPQFLVNAAAYTAVDKAESEKSAAHRINVEAVSVMAEEARNIDAMVIHYSTDYVFDGNKKAAYTESDATDPLNVYGLSKRDGELALASSGAKYWIFRTSWVYGVHGHNFLKTMLRLAQQKDSLSVVADQYGAPTSAALIADITAHAIKAANDGPLMANGVYHLAATGETSWYHYACYVLARAQKLGMSLRCTVDDIKPVLSHEYSLLARRPHSSRLDCRKLENALNIQLPEWRLGVNQTTDLLVELSH